MCVWFSIFTKLQALVYDILHPATAVGLEKLSANRQFFIGAQMYGQFFVGAQMSLNLQRTTQIIAGVSLITAHVSYAGTNKAKIV